MANLTCIYCGGRLRDRNGTIIEDFPLGAGKEYCWATDGDGHKAALSAPSAPKGEV